jgi:hypothetical protein
MTRAAALCLVLMLAGCASPAAMGLAGAALGFGAAVVGQGTEIITIWHEDHAPPVRDEKR